MNSSDMEVCERLNQDVIAIPFLAIAVKEKTTNETYFNTYL